MRIVATPTVWNEADGLIPIDVQDIDIVATAGELDALAGFFADAARRLRETGRSNASMDFSDSKPNAQTGIWVSVKDASE